MGALRACGLTWAARLTWRGGRLAAARALAEESVALHRTLGEAGDARGYAWALTVLGTVAYFERRLDAAATALQDALALARRHGHEEVVTSALFAQDHLAWVRGDLATTQQRYARALARWRRLGDGTGVATALRALGALALQPGDLENAAARFAEALALYRDLGRRAGATNVSVTLAGLALDAGETDAARRLLREPLADAPARLAEEVGSQLRSSGSASPSVRELGRGPGARGTRPPLAVETIWFSLPRVLLSLACVATAERQPERALRLAGAAEALNPAWRTGAPGRPHAGGQDPLVDRADRWLAVARAALTPPAQDAAWAAGQAMTLAEAVTDALAEAPDPG